MDSLEHSSHLKQLADCAATRARARAGAGRNFAARRPLNRFICASQGPRRVSEAVNDDYRNDIPIGRLKSLLRAREDKNELNKNKTPREKNRQIFILTGLDYVELLITL